MLLDRENPVHYPWLVYLEMFIAGVAAGAYIAAALLEAHGRGTSATARAAHLLAFPLMALAGLLLIIDLGRPERFWHMVVMSEQFLPMLKPWSPISYGTWLVLLFSLFTFVSFLDALIARRVLTLRGWRYDRTLHGGPLGLIWSLLGSVLAVAVAIYSGILLTVTNIPGWAQTPLLPAVFIATALMTGVAAVVLLQTLSGRLDADVAGLWQANGWLIGLWLVVVAAFLASLFGGGARFFLFGLPLVAIVLAIVLGGIVPLVLRVISRPEQRSMVTLSAVLVLVGGLLIRYALVEGPQLYIHP